MGKRIRFYRQVISTALGLSLMLSPLGGLYASEVKGEVKKSQTSNGIASHWAGETLQKWKEQGYITGDSVGNINPDALITRAELAALINRSFQFETKVSISYSDIKKSAWYYDDLSIAVSQGYMKGYSNKTFKPDGNVTRQELAVILSSLMELKPRDPASDFLDTVNSPTWSKGAIGAVSSSGLMKGSKGKFRPSAGASRAEAVTVLDRAIDQIKSKEVTNYDKAGTYGSSSGTEKVSGSVYINAPDITLKNMIIEGDLVIGEGVGEGDVTLNGVTVKGRTTVKGGGKNSIHVVDSVLITVIVNKKDGSVRIVTEGSSSVSQITLQSGAILEETGLTGEGFKDLLLSELIPAGSNVSLAGKFETVDVTAASLNVKLASGSVGQLNVGSNASGTNLNVGAAASILSLILNASANVNGQGSIGSAQVNATGVSFSQRPGNLVLGDNITVNMGGGTSSGSSSGSNNNGGSDINPPEPVMDRIQLTNGQAILQFANAVPALELSDLNVSATVGDAVYTLEGISFNNSLKSLTFNEIPLKEHYGKNFVLKVAPAPGTTKFTTALTGNVKLEGFEGTITDVDNLPVEGMKIEFRRGLGNTTGSIAATVLTNRDGRYNVNLPAGIYTGQLTKTGFITTYVVGVSLTDSFNQAEDATAIKIPASDEIRIVLTWGEHPRDEDSHLLGPTVDGRSFHTYFGDRQHYYRGELYADLDHDDVDSYGPETTTIRKRVDGKYQFYIHNYSRNGYDGTETLRNSSAKVEIYNGSNAAPVKTYHIPTGSGNEIYWYVFDMEVDGAELNFTDHNQLVEDEPQSDLPPSIEYDFSSYIEGDYIVDQSQKLRVQSGYYNTEDQVYLRFSLDGLENSDLIEMKTSEGEQIPFTTKVNAIEAVYGSADNGFNVSDLDLQFDLKFKQEGLYTLKTEIVDVYSDEVIETLYDNVDIKHDLEAALLTEEEDKLLSSSTVSYITTVGDAVYLTDRDNTLLNDTSVIIESLELNTPTNVTDSVYLAQNNDSIKLVNYNDGDVDLNYTATVKLMRGSLISAPYTITIIVPTLDQLLDEAIAFADELIKDARPENLINARATADQAKTGSKEEQILALNQLAALLIEYI